MNEWTIFKEGGDPPLTVPAPGRFNDQMEAIISQAAPTMSFGNASWSTSPFPTDPIAALKARPTRVHMELKTISGGEYQTTIPLTLSLLMVPQTIDLAATS
jgi:hypothetical protein